VTFATLVLCCSFSAIPIDDDWTRFRGPNGSGVADVGSLPAEFGPQQNLIWRTELPPGHSSPVLWNDRIFLTAVENDILLTIAIDRESGQELWRREAPRDRREALDPRNNPASPSPAVDASGAYVFFPDFGLLGYSHDGELRWQRPLGPFNNIYGMGASPVLCDDRIILNCDQNLGSFIAAFDRSNGEQIWKTDRPEATSGHCTPILYRPASGPAQIIAVGSFYVTAYAIEDGAKVWWVGGLCFEMKSTPVIGGDLLYINGYGSPMNEADAEFRIDNFDDVVKAKDGNGDGFLGLDEMPDELAKNFFPAIDLDGGGTLDRREWEYFQQSIASKNSMLAIRLGGEGDMTAQNTVWKYVRNIPQLPSPLLYRDRLYMINDQGIATCLDPATGTALHRGRLEGASGNFYASPVAGDGKLFFVSEEGKVAVADASDSFDVIAVNELGERCYATPALDQRRIYVRSEKALYAFGQDP
jgi:outer membrane protein assembly factor BamB